MLYHRIPTERENANGVLVQETISDPDRVLKLCVAIDDEDCAAWRLCRAVFSVRYATVIVQSYRGAQKEAAMKFGLMHDFRNPAPWFRPYSDLYRLLLDQCVRADELGYDNIWLTEHHFSGDYNPTPLQAATAIAARTERIRIGTFVLLLPFYHPVRVAEDVAFIDNLSKGRFDLGVGQGYRVDEFSGFCMPRKERSARLAEGLDLIRRLWTEETVTFEGKFTQIKEVHIQPEPVQQPHPPIWIGARTEKAMQRAAREGYHLPPHVGPGLGSPLL